MNSREERNRQFFTDDESLLLNPGTDSWLTEPSFSQSDENFWQSGAQTQKSVLLQIEESEELVRQATEREQEVGHIVRSISDLNHIFKVSLLRYYFSRLCFIPQSPYKCWCLDFYRIWQQWCMIRAAYSIESITISNKLRVRYKKAINN